MARRVLTETDYTFTPSTRTITFTRAVPRERLLLITNVTTNTVIFNFSDPTLTATSYTIAQNTNVVAATTTIVLSYNTTSMSASDKLQITIDEISEVQRPAEEYIDPVGKMRVSIPQSLIDTDFEYGLQPTKWETITLLNNKPDFFVNTQNPITVSNVTSTANSTTVTVFTTTPPAVGTPILINDTEWSGANGKFIITANSAGTSFTYTARYPFTNSISAVMDTRIYNVALTSVYSGTFYSNANYMLATQPTYSGNVVTIQTVEPHGLSLNNGIYIAGASASTNPPNGSWFVSRILSANIFEISADLTPTGSISGATVYPRPDGYYIHRAYDGGVQFTTGNPGHSLQTVRQTRRYFRYQSGKGIQISTGTILKPNFNVDDMSSSGTLVTVVTKTAHFLNVGATIVVAGANETGYNGTFTVNQIINQNKFNYIATTVPSASTASGIITVSVSNWYGAATRIGLFDFQNGVFFEYDGQQCYAVRRRSIEQISGFVNVTLGSSDVVGATVNNVTTKFSKQLVPGDWIVIRGQSYRVDHIVSDTLMRILPAYRGPTIAQPGQTIVTKTTEVRIPQSQWNIDKCDGTGPSGYNLDLTKMQMFYIDYSWYGAGEVRFGFRDTQGKVFYCHRMVNNNVNYEAYMRSGNLPARYETHTFPSTTILTANCLSTDTSLTVANTSTFPNSGILLIDNPNFTEFVNYTGKTNTSFTGLTRGLAGGTVSGNTVVDSPNIITTSDVTNMQVGSYIYGPGLPSGTFIASKTTGNPSILSLTTAAFSTNTLQTYTIRPMGALANTHVFSNTAPISIYLHSPQFAPTISHWGTSVIMDGRFDDDKSFIFTYGETTDTVIPPGATYALFSLRAAPAVDAGIPSTFGLKELINRMQVTLRQLDVMTSGRFLVTLVLNGVVSGGTPGSFSSVATGTSSLSQVCDHTGASTISGGEVIYGFYAVNSAGSGGAFETIQQDLNQVRDLANSVLGGGINNTPGILGMYPDGPDVVTVTARNIGPTTSNIQARLSWTEAQA